MRKILYGLLPLFLAACEQSGGMQPVDNQKYLSGLEGPKIAGLEDTLAESAKNAEKEGDYALAAQLWQQLLSKRPDDKEVMQSLADDYRRNAEYDRAIGLYDKLIAKGGDTVAAKEGKGLALLATGDYNSPGDLFGDVMQSDPKRWKTLNALGILFVTRNMQPEAQAYFKEALKFSPGNTAIMNNMGLSQAIAHNYDGAVTTLTQAAELSTPGSITRKRIDLNLAMVYAADNKMDKARSIAETYFSGAALENNLGLYAHLAKDDEMAKAYLNMALTDSKVFYEKAWGNLQALDSNGTEGTIAAPAQDAPEDTADKIDLNPAPKKR